LEATPTKEVFIVTSKVCPTTIAMGENFTDANKRAIAFDAAALKFVNLDASRSGGITTVWTTGPVK
jgi:L-alanine-DL-glutamate epimerase-like enolase superfamily enzyme